MPLKHSKILKFHDFKEITTFVSLTWPSSQNFDILFGLATEPRSFPTGLFFSLNSNKLLMITYMQFIDKEVQFAVSELDTKDQVTVTMESMDDFQTFLAISLSGQEIRRLRDWLNESIAELDILET